MELGTVKKLAPEVGFEPTTNRLTADRSTTELLRIVKRMGNTIATVPIFKRKVQRIANAVPDSAMLARGGRAF
jgi:hypothetical protein